MSLRIPTCFLFIFLMSHSGGAYAAQVVQECAAERFVKCPSFSVSRTIGEHTPVTVRPLAGFVRSKGRWTITVGYGPAEKCAKVSFWVNMGPLDFDRKYDRVFINGGGSISDSGSFIHEVDNLESALRVHSSSCRVPAPDPRPEGRPDSQTHRTDAESKEREILDEERERQELEEERERQAMEEERERLALDEERRRLEEEQRLAEQRRERERQRLAEERRERERRRLAEERRERERRRLAEERRERERRRLAAERRERERKRLARQRREQERRRAKEQSDADAAAAMALIGGFLQGLAGGSGSPGYIGGSPSYGGSGGGCERIGERLARELEMVNNVHANSICGMGRGTARALTRARNQLAARNCASRRELADMDRSIRQARATARASCSR